jgi:hypothetical membrane protein
VRRWHELLGMAGPVLAFIAIAASIRLSPWFRWDHNALSDLGHAVRSDVAPIFNLGLSLASASVLAFSVTAFRKHAKYSSVGLGASAIFLQLIATFDEVYGHLHFFASVFFFVSIGVTAIALALEKRSRVALSAFAVTVAAWVLYGIRGYGGIALPETVSSAAMASLLIHASVGIYTGKVESLAR